MLHFQIEIDLDSNFKGKYDESNALVLPAKKRLTKKLRDKNAPAKLLSKRQRKHLEKVVDKKRKKSLVSYSHPLLMVSWQSVSYILSTVCMAFVVRIVLYN